MSKTIPLTTAEVADVLGVTPGRVRQLRTEKNGLPSSFTTLSGQHLYLLKDVAKFQKRRAK